MRKSVWIMLGVLVIVTVGAGVYVSNNSSTSSNKSNSSTAATSTSTKSTSSTTYKPVKACDVFTLEDAKKVLGPEAIPGSSDANSHVTQSNDVVVTTCTYTAGTPTAQNITTLFNASILARAAKTKLGANTNTAQFGPKKPASAQDVSGYGDAAYWNPTYGQLNILKSHNWYILSVGPTVNPASRTLDNAKKLADTVIDKL